MPGPQLTRKRPDERADMESAPTAWGSMLVIAPEAPGLPESCGPQMCGPCNAARQAKNAPGGMEHFPYRPERHLLL